MPVKHVKRISVEQANKLLQRYPNWVGRTGLLFNQDARGVTAASEWRKRFREANPEEYAKRQKETNYRRKLREAGLLEPFKSVGKYARHGDNAKVAALI